MDREPALLLRESLDEGTRLLATVADDDADGRFRIALWALNTELATLLPAQARGLLSPKVPGRLAELRAARRPRIGAAASWRTRDSVVHSSGRLSTLGHCGSVSWEWVRLGGAGQLWPDSALPVVRLCWATGGSAASVAQPSSRSVRRCATTPQRNWPVAINKHPARKKLRPVRGCECSPPTQTLVCAWRWRETCRHLPRCSTSSWATQSSVSARR